MDLSLTALLDREEAFWRAAGSRDAYEAGLAPDAVHVFPGWGVADRESVLDGVASARPWDDVAVDDPRLVPLDRDAAALVYVARARRGRDEYRAAITSVYRRRDEDVELVLHQQTPLEG
jgi:hypothetical protein